MVDDAGRNCKFKRTAYSGEHIKAILRPLIHRGVIDIDDRSASKQAAVELCHYLRDGRGDEAVKSVHEIASKAIHCLREELKLQDTMTVPFAQVHRHGEPP